MKTLGIILLAWPVMIFVQGVLWGIVSPGERITKKKARAAQVVGLSMSVGLALLLS
jgi:hypothetical protein